VKDKNKFTEPKKDMPEKIEKKSAPKTVYPGYVIDLGDPGLNDMIKMVKFTGGIGVLDISALKVNRPDWFNRAGEQTQGVYLEMYKGFWLGRGAKVTVVLDEEAIKFKLALAAGDPLPDRFYRTPPKKESKKTAEAKE
jgi:hypothetical protein